MEGDESYAGSRSYIRFRIRAEHLRIPAVIPTHQDGRRTHLFSHSQAADVVPNNTHFDTTRANVEATGAERSTSSFRKASSPAHPSFKGNMDVAALTETISRCRPQTHPLVMLTSPQLRGGQPSPCECPCGQRTVP